MNLERKDILVTKIASFIESNLVLYLLRTLFLVILWEVDNVNDYYDVKIKE